MSTNTTANEQLAVIDQFPEKINDIKKALDNLVVTEKKVAELKENYTGVTIIDENDEEGYKLAREAKSVLVKTRTSSEDDRKVALKPIDELRDTVHNRFMSAQNDLKIVEAPISSRIKEIDDIEKKRKEDEKEAQEKKINDRINELLSKGMVFDNISGYYVIGDKDLEIPETSIGVVDIRTMSDDLYQNFLQMVEDKSSKIAAEKERLAEIAAKEKADKEAADKAEREEFDRKKKEFDDQQAVFKKQQDDMKAQQDKLDKDKREAELQIQQAEQQRKNDLIKHRSAVLAGIGMAYNQSNDVFAYEEIEVSSDYIVTAPEPGWLEVVEEVTGKIKVKKEAHAKFLQEQEELQKKKDKEAADLAEKERLAGMQDVEILKEYIKTLLAVPAPTIKTKRFKAAVDEITGSLKGKLDLLKSK